MTKAEIKAAMRLKPIAILGLGTAGRGVRALAERLGVSSTCFDESDIEGVRQDFTIADARQHSVVVVSPGFNPNHPWVICAQSAGVEVMGELDFGALFLNRPVYAVTGTNGKTVTGRFITHTLESLGQNVALLGNTGISLCGWLSQNLENEPTTKLILEISSYQAHLLKYLPIEGLIWTNFSETHLDYHGSPREYFLAKWNLFRLLTSPLAIVGQSVFEAANRFGCVLPDFLKVVPGSPNSPYDALPQGTVFDESPFAEDFRLCATFGDLTGIPFVIWHQTAASFILPRYRMSRIAQVDGVSFYNDAKSSNTASTLAGLARFNMPVLWIGGLDAPLKELESFVSEIAPKIRVAYLVGRAGGMLATQLRHRGIECSYFESIEDAFTQLCRDMEAGDKVVFSPGFPPVGRFETFAGRGNFFEKMVLELQSSHHEHRKV
jgi:UDP-N-acetylmuramoylalanine--D-glutamate ligase